MDDIRKSDQVTPNDFDAHHPNDMIREESFLERNETAAFFNSIDQIPEMTTEVKPNISERLAEGAMITDLSSDNEAEIANRHSKQAL